MIFWLALLICSAGVAGLFYLNRDKSVRNSMALWLPVIWLGIAGSRPVSTWFGPGGEVGLASTLDGSPMDAAIYAALLAMGVIVLLRRNRKKRTSAFLAANGLIVLYFLYCLISVMWSPIHGPAFKRWIKAIGDLVMVFVIVTDGEPVAALRRLYTRVGFILFPFSIFLIRYTDLGRGYTPDGAPENTGVTTNKNSLGLIVFLVSLGALWNARALLLDKKTPNRTQRLVAQGTLLTFGIVLLQMAHSATAVACFILGAGLMLLTTRRAFRNRPGRVYALCLAIVLGGGLAMLFGGGSVVSNALGRGSGLSGRTDIWNASISAADNPVFGTGFESFWNTNIEKVAAKLPGYWEIHNLVSAHNGYIEVYLDLGLVGVCLIALIILNGYRRGSKAFQREPEIGGLILAYIVTATFYSLTEAGFRVLTPMWIFLLLAVIIASGVATGIFGGGGVKILGSRRRRASRAAASDKLVPEGEIVRAVRSGLNRFEIDHADNFHHA
jgi:exopolysaccharide production protein ExoQ